MNSTPNRAAGFTLLEMMVATVILAIAIVGLVAAISGSLRNAARLTAYDRAVELARQRMNELLLDDRLPQATVLEGGFDPQQTGGLPAGWRARLTLDQKPPVPMPGETAIERVELEVWWMSGDQRRTFQLEAYKPHTLRGEDIVPNTAP
ncbi:MAG TPA: type II secretion system protein [Bryobacteraceae bacterium]|nr:type II secretion system protein [Bryobacteraceae bacterium]